MFRLLKRTTETAVKLPFAIAWDFISLGNMGDGSSTEKVLWEHEAKKRLDGTTACATWRKNSTTNMA